MRPRTFFLLFFIITPLSQALQVQPTVITEDGGPGTTFEQVFTIINNDPRPLSLSIELDKYSTYLEESVSITETNIFLKPQETTNIQLRGTIPSLGPETHTLQYNIKENEQIIGSFAVLIPIQGNSQLAPKISLEALDVVEDEPVSVDISLYNFGNIIAYYNLSLYVHEGEELIGEITYPEAVQTLPGEQEQLTLLYTDKLEPGEYTVTIAGQVNGEEEVVAEQPFRVVLADQEKTIRTGEDLVLTIKRYNDIPRVEYTVKRGSEELLKDTSFVNAETITIPTAKLGAGTYDITIRVTHGQGTDTTRLTLNIREETNIISLPLIAIIVFGGIIALIFTPTVQRRIRISLLERKIARREKLLNTLIRRAHQLARQ